MYFLAGTPGSLAISGNSGFPTYTNGGGAMAVYPLNGNGKGITANFDLNNANTNHMTLDSPTGLLSVLESVSAADDGSFVYVTDGVSLLKVVVKVLTLPTAEAGK
jgi:hypothetical protein